MHSWAEMFKGRLYYIINWEYQWNIRQLYVPLFEELPEAAV